MSDKQKNLRNNEGAPESWCPLPWSHLSIKSNGTFRVCCHSNSSDSEGTFYEQDGSTPVHISTAKWNEVINNPTLKTVRKEMLEGKWPEACSRCKREHDAGMKSRNFSERSTLANLLNEKEYASYKKAKENTLEDGTITKETFPITFLDIRFGNLCNLKCTMCGPSDSDQWYDEYVKLWNQDHFYDNGKKISLIKNDKGKYTPKNKTFNWNNDTNLWNEIETYMHEFRKIYVVGGEPLMIDAHYDFLQKCVDEGYASELVVEYNSNITNIPQRAWNIWKNFKEIIMGISIDGLGNTNDLIRFPSKWWKIEENLQKLTTAEGNYNLHIAYAVQVLNSWQLPEFLEYLLDSNYNRLHESKNFPLCIPHPVHRPQYLNLSILPKSYLLDLKNRYEHYKIKFKNKKYKDESNGVEWDQKINHACKILDEYLDYANKENFTDSELIYWRKRFIMFMDTLDKTRNTNWDEVLPELYNATMPWRKY